MTVQNLLVLLFSLSLSLGSHARETNTPETNSSPNGCGSGWNLPFVPDSIALVGCKFKDSCDQHDLCYSVCDKSYSGDCEYRRCRKGGDLFQSDECFTNVKLISLATQAQERKKKCDGRLADDIRSVNKGKLVCEAFALIYKEAVKMWGDGSFSGFGTGSQVSQTEREYSEALRKFLINGTDEQFRSFLNAYDSGNPSVNLKKPITYDQSRGLENLSRTRK